MKRLLLWLSLAFGTFISVFAVYYMLQGIADVEAVAVTAVLIVFAFYPFNFLLLMNHKQRVASTLEKILQWPFFGRKDKVPVNLGPWWANRLENAILLTSFAPFLLILFLAWLAKLIRSILF